MWIIQLDDGGTLPLFVESYSNVMGRPITTASKPFARHFSNFEEAGDWAKAYCGAYKWLLVSHDLETKTSIWVSCRTNEGQVGTFIAAGDRVPISPVFDGLAGLYPWMAANGWLSTGKAWFVEKV